MQAAPGKRTQVGELAVARRVEAVTGADLSGVGVHADEAAAAEAKANGARAFARGQDVFFGAGELAPGTRDGDFLIAHELAHTVQQRGGGGSMQLFAIASGSAPDRAEHEANEIARRAVDGGDAMRVTAAPVGVARFTTSDETGCASQRYQPSPWDDRFTDHKPVQGNPMTYEEYKDQIGVNPKLENVHDHTAKEGTPLSPVEISPDEMKEIASASTDPGAVERALQYLPQCNAAFVTMKIDTVQAQADFLGNSFGESGSFGSFSEIGGDKKAYAPFWGRGSCQVTWEAGYASALAYIDRRISDLAEEIDAKEAAGEDVTKLREQQSLCIEAFKAIQGNIDEAANPKYAFLISAAHMYSTHAVTGAKDLTKGTPFNGTQQTDSWESGGMAGQPFTDPGLIDRAKVKSAVFDKAMDVLMKKKVQPAAQPPAAKP
jgi:hypothetical protein